MEMDTLSVNGKEYKFAAKVPKNEIPEGFVEATLEYGPNDYNVIYSEELELYLAYLVDEDSYGELFMYVEENATFAPYRSIDISDSTTIVILSEVSDIYLPEEYKFYQDAIAINGQDFPGWKNAEKPGYCVIYALNNHGQKTLYELDAEEGTYQRFEAPEVERKEKGLLASLTGVLQNHLDRVIIVGGFTFLFLIIVIMVVSIKLYNRNVELDEMYDKYGFDDDDDDDDDDEDDEDVFGARGNAYKKEEEEDDINLLVEDINEFLPQEMKEIFPEDQKESTQEILMNLKTPTETEAKKQPEETLGNVLAKQKEEASDDESLEDDDMLENFMMDFIDLDD